MNLNKYIKHHELYEFLRTKVDIPPIERTFHAAQKSYTSLSHKPALVLYMSVVTFVCWNMHATTIVFSTISHHHHRIFLSSNPFTLVFEAWYLPCFFFCSVRGTTQCRTPPPKNRKENMCFDRKSASADSANGSRRASHHTVWKRCFLACGGRRLFYCR